MFLHEDGAEFQGSQDVGVFQIRIVSDRAKAQGLTRAADEMQASASR